MFAYSYKNTSESLGEREIEVRTRARKASVSTQFRVLSNFHECFYNVWEHGKNCFLFLKYIAVFLTRRKLKRGNSLLYQSINSLYKMVYAMADQFLSGICDSVCVNRILELRIEN